MEEKNVNMAIKLSIITAILLISFSIFYYFVIFLPTIQKSKLNQQKEKELSEAVSRDWERIVRSGCVTTAEKQAMDLIKTKAELQPYLYKEAAQKDLFLKADYETAYGDCLRRAGLEK